MTLETAKALKEAGWEKETEKYWFKQNEDDWFRVPATPKEAEYVGYKPPFYPCPSLEELLAELRDVFLWKTKLCYHAQLNGKPETECISNNPTESVAQLWLKLRKEGIV